MGQRVLLLGAHGHVGRALQRSVTPDIHLVALGSGDADITDAAAVDAAVAEVRPATIINCAGFTHVDNAESQPDRAAALNSHAPRQLAAIAMRHGVRLVHLSTDYVFDGVSSSPYETSAFTSPLSVYGRTKADGENAVLAMGEQAAVVRTAWVHSVLAVNFVRAVCDHVMNGKTMRVVNDQVSTPTQAGHLAHALWALVARPEVHGMLHFTDAGSASRYDVAMATSRELVRRNPSWSADLIVPVPTREYPTPARRPLYSVLDKHSSWNAIGYMPPHWMDGVTQTVREVLDA